MYIGVRAFGINVQSNFIFIRHFDWPYKKIIIRSVVSHIWHAQCAAISNESVVLLVNIPLELKRSHYCFFCPSKGRIISFTTPTCLHYLNPRVYIIISVAESNSVVSQI